MLALGESNKQLNALGWIMEMIQDTPFMCGLGYLTAGLTASLPVISLLLPVSYTHLHTSGVRGKG